MPRKRNTGRAAKHREAMASREPEDLSHLLGGARRTESKRGAEWVTQPIPAARALKDYVCPECGNTIPPGMAHVVVWRNDHLFGDEAAVSERRHWHDHCWRLAR